MNTMAHGPRRGDGRQVATHRPTIQAVAGETGEGGDRPGEAVQRELAAALAGSPRAVQLQAMAERANGAAGDSNLPTSLRAGVEALSGVSMAGVQVHYNSPRPAQLQAAAFTQGRDIHVAPGAQRHLPHEAWHVVQQAQGRVRPTRQMGDGTPLNDEGGLEREADRMGRRAAVATVQAKAVAGPAGQQALRPVVQRFESDEQAAEQGTEFRTLSAQEFALNAEITTLVQTFQDRPTAFAHEAMMGQIDPKREAITALHQQLAAIVALYEAAPNGQKEAFFNAYLADKPQAYGGNGDDPDMNRGQIRALFDSLAGKTDAVNAAGDDEEPDLRTAERGRFLTFMLQGLHDDMGADQYRNLNRLLGDGRRIRVDRVGPNNLSAGLANAAHNQYGNKTDDGGADQDAELLQQGGSGLEFLRRKFQHGYARTANDQRDQIGDVQVNMDRDDLLTPLFAGMAGDRMKLFAAPKKFTVHHEIGHVISALEGKSGSGRAMGAGLANLSDQEEMHNIWGGPRSDRAYGAALGLPQRFDHRSLVTYYGDGGGDYQDFTETLKSGYRFTATLDRARALVLAEVRRLLDSHWGGITTGIWSAPDGVKALRKLFPGPPTVAQVRDRAAQHAAGAGGNRHPFTTAFYNTLAALAPDDKEALIDAYLALKKMTVPDE